MEYSYNSPPLVGGVRGGDKCIIMKVSIIETRGVIWEGMAKRAILPAKDGQICVLDNHQPFLVCLKEGAVRLPEMETQIKDGIALMNANELKVFVEF